MMTDRQKRLEQDYREMLRIQDRPYLSWIVTKGELPYAEEYLLSVRLRSYALSVISDRYVVSEADRFTVKVTLWDSYPRVAPNIRMLSIPPVFVPAWYSKGTYCPPELWRVDISLKEYVKQMLRTLQYAPDVIDSKAPANYKALSWYRKHKEDASIFPSDITELSENTDERVAALERAALIPAREIDSWPIR